MKIKTVTPIRIGSGEKYSEYNYLIKENKLIRFNLSKILEIESKKNKELMENLIKGKLGLFKIRRITESYPELFLYTVELDEKINTNAFKVEECIKDPYYKPYIPGSSIKGVIRTLIVWKILKENQDLVKKLNEKVRIELKKDQKVKYFLNNFINSLLVYDNKREDTDKRLEYRSIMKFIGVSDFFTKEKNALIISMVERKGVKTNIKVYKEFIKKGVLFEGEIKLKEELLNRKEIKITNNYLMNFLDFSNSKNFIDSLKRISKEFFEEKRNLEKEKSKGIINYPAKLEFPLVIGSNKGFLWQTVLEFVDERYRNNLIKKFNIGQPPGKKKKKDVFWDKFPKTFSTLKGEKIGIIEVVDYD